MIVTVLLAGGLGNQLFQYAAGRSLADARGAELVLDTSSYISEPLGREYRLDRYSVRARIVQRKSRFTRIRRRIDRRLPEPLRRHAFIERTLAYDSRLLALNHSVELRGYWQSERYFTGNAAQIRQDLTLREPPIGRNAELAQEIAVSTAVSLHVRRGDYLVNDTHGVLPVEFYQAAVERIARRGDDPRLYVFSDDIPWCRQNLSLGYPTTFVDHNGPSTDTEDLRLMSLCKHHVIANSSFSWWGAWLADWPGQIVIAPQRWFAQVSVERASRFPMDWELL